MDQSTRSWQKFALYGEELAQVAPEFLHAESISSRSRLHDWNIQAHSHPGMHQVLLLLRGGGQLHADGMAFALAPRTLVVVPSLCVHAFSFDAGSEGWVLSLAVELMHDPRMAAARGLAILSGRQAMQAQLPEGSAALARLDFLLSDFAAERADAEGAGRRLAQLGLVLACAQEAMARSSAPATAEGRGALAASFRALVEENFAARWSVADYAAHLATTEQTLTRACRAAFDRSPAAIVQERLLLEAVRHLRYSPASIKQVADRLGFADPAYFARFFKKMTGRTAGEFRADPA